MVFSCCKELGDNQREELRVGHFYIKSKSHWPSSKKDKVERSVMTLEMNTKKLSKSTRKFIRGEKARIRHTDVDLQEREKLLSELYKRFHAV